MLKDGTLNETKIFIPHEGKIVSKVTYHNADVLDANKEQRNAFNKHEQYKGDFIHAARIHEGDIIRLRNMGYDLLSPDLDEWKRCLLYIQQNEPYLLTVDGKPFAKKRVAWS